MSIDFERLRIDLELPEAGVDWTSNLLNRNSAELQANVRPKMIRSIVIQTMDLIACASLTEANNWILLAICSHERKAIKEIQKTGLLRISKYGFRAAGLQTFVRKLQQSTPQLSFQEATKNYFTSVEALLRAGKDVSKSVDDLRKHIKSRPDSFLKSIVATTDIMFMSTRLRDPRGQVSMENLAEGASFLLHLFSTEVGLKVEHLVSIDEDGIIAGRYEKILHKAAKVRHYMEAEVQLDSCLYACRRKGENIELSPISENYEKSLRLGYILNDQARASSHQRVADSHGDSPQFSSIIKIADAAYDKLGELIIKRIPLPIDRIRLEFSQSTLIRGLLNNIGFTKEEHIALQEVADSELMTWDEIEKTEICDGLFALDLLYIFRFFSFAARVMAREIETISEDEINVGYRSLLPVFPINSFRELAASCIPNSSPEKIETAIRLLSSELPCKGVFDLQYTPIIRIDDHFLIPLNITSTMNWWRNLFQKQYKRAIEYAEEEAASRHLYSELNGKVEHLRKGFETTLKGETVEFDVIARWDTTLFVFECKHPYVPVNAFEIRTSIAHIVEGEEQLNKISRLLKDKENEKELYQRLNWDCGPAQKISTCIVSCNGMFPGYRAGEHPVRRIHEMTRFLDTGKAKVARFSVDLDRTAQPQYELVDVNNWGEGQSEINSSIFDDYVEGDRLSDPLFQSMEPVNHHVSVFRKYKLYTKSFALNIITFSKLHFPN